MAQPLKGGPFDLASALEYVQTILALQTVRHFELQMASIEALQELKETIEELGCTAEADPEGLRLRIRCPGATPPEAPH